MIVRMKRVHLVMLEADKEESLSALGKLGALHLEEPAAKEGGLSSLWAVLHSLERARGFLEGRKKCSLPPASHDARALAAEVEEGIAAEKALLERKARIQAELERLSAFGEIDPAAFAAFRERGYELSLHLLPERPAPSFPEGSQALDLGRAGRGKLHAWLSLSPSGNEGLPESVCLPERGTAELRRELEEIEEERRRIEASFDRARGSLPLIEAEIERLGEILEFEGLRASSRLDGTLARLSGWLPEKAVAAFTRLAAEREWGYSLEEPAPEEEPPTKVENPAAIRIIQPVFDFLGTIPGYREYDISALFLVFLTIFFAMIFGDAGYGCLLLAASLFLLLKARAAKKAPPAMAWLILVFSSATVAWGALTGSWFSQPEASIPAFLRALALPPLASWNPESGKNVQIVCFSIGLVQLSIAHLKNIVRDFPRPRFIAQVGSLCLLAGLFGFVLNLVIDSSRFPVRPYNIYLIIFGFLANFVFGSWERNLGQSLLDGLKNIVSTVLGTVSVFSDIISYIRLWAVGMAGVAISQTVNGMAGGALSWGSGLLRALLGLLVCLVGLGVGHGLNLLMSVLSVVVHGIRLNMLEFSGHLGMEWSGYAYRPFRAEGGADKRNGKESS